VITYLQTTLGGDITMRKHTLILGAAVILFSLNQAISSSPTNEVPASQVKDVRDFAIDGVKLGMAFGEFQKLFPGATLIDSRPDLKWEAYTTDTTNTDAVHASFFEGKIISIIAVYESKRTNEIGGDDVIKQRLEKRFGRKATAIIDKTGADDIYLGAWVFPEKSFVCAFSVYPQWSLITVTDINDEERLNKKKSENADVGF
jgi:hypothetical protein